MVVKKKSNKFLNVRFSFDDEEKTKCFRFRLDIDEKDLLSPLLVVQTLSNNQSTTLDLLKVKFDSKSFRFDVFAFI